MCCGGECSVYRVLHDGPFARTQTFARLLPDLDFKNTTKETFVCFVLNMAQILVQHRKNSRTCIHINTQMASSAGFCSSRHSYFCLSSTCLLFFEQHAHYCSSTFAGMPTEHINVLEFLKSANVKSKI